MITGIISGGLFYENWNQNYQAAVMIEPNIPALEEEKPTEKRPLKVNRKVNILVLGTDNRGDEVARSDTMMLVTANAGTQQVVVISIPRDTRVDIPGVGLTKINHANAVGEMRGGVHEGTLESAKAVSNLLGLPINYYVKIDFQGFEKVVDAVGGVDVTLPYPVSDKGIKLAAGTHHLTGEQALRVVRIRYGLTNGDFSRQQDQFILLAALGEKVLSLSNIPKLPELINIVYQELLDTNMSTADLVALGLDFKGMTQDDLKYYQLPGKGITATDPLVGASVYYFEPDMDGVREIAQHRGNKEND